MKQVNLALAAAGDVAVLRNGERRNIISIEDTTYDNDFVTYALKFNDIRSGNFTYYKDGVPKYNHLNYSIADVLRNRVSIFEQSK